MATLRGDAGSSATDERGSTTVLMPAVIAVLMVLVVLGIHLGGAVLTRHRVAAAADLAALAAAGWAVAGTEEACGRARWVVERMGATLTACRIAGWQSYVEATARPPGWAALSGTANAHARAGPAEVPGGR